MLLLLPLLLLLLLLSPPAIKKNIAKFNGTLLLLFLLLLIAYSNSYFAVAANFAIAIAILNGHFNSSTRVHNLFFLIARGGLNM